MRSFNIDHSITNRSEGSMKRYLAEIDKIPLLKMGEEVLLCRRVQQGDLAAMDKLVRANLRFVVSCSKKYEHMGLPISDLVSEGNMGLMTAAERFDESRGFKFISYAVWWIRQAMMMALSKHKRMIYLPQSMVRTTTEIRAWGDKLMQDLEREPTFEEIAREMDLDPNAQAFLLATGPSVSSLDNTVQAESGVHLWELLADRNCKGSDCLVLEESISIQVRGLLGLLNERERVVISAAFGLTGDLPRGCDDIGEMLRLTSERVRQIRDGALAKMKNRVRDRGILHAY
jgi:RNA polymerase primary sigma factor